MQNLITTTQYSCLRSQEGKSWYNQEIIIGDLDGYPIKTITHDVPFEINKPSMNYIKTILLGLIEMKKNKEFCLNYLVTKKGVAGAYSKEDLGGLYELVMKDIR